MDKQALLKKISQLEQAAQQMDEPDKTFKLDDISQLKISIDRMAVSDIAEKMQSIELTSIKEIDSSIQLAKKATSSHIQRVSAFNIAYGIIKGAIGLAL
ncbi:hypothetical protein [Vibrio owensii]|uniref:hypothetical protein n=1 Tax=Vibrio owensii TaxID=696485 RepID=UPI0040693A25